MPACALSRITRAPVTIVLIVAAFVPLRPTGDPATIILGPDAPRQACQAFRRNRGSDEPLWVRSLACSGAVMEGDPGRSMRDRRAAPDIVRDRALTAPALWSALEGTMRTTAMVMLIVLAAFFLNFVMVSIGLTNAITGAVQGLDLSPTSVLLMIVAVYLVLGCFMETLSLMIATTPVVAPIVAGLGYDLVWFGVLFMILIEAALITPPIGVNLFVVQGVRGEARGPIREVMLGALPFLAMMIAMILLLIAVPGLALLLPETFVR